MTSRPTLNLKFQLVIQFPGSSIKDYDEMIAIEDAIIKSLGSVGIVDGHDAGSGETNIFVITNDPQAAFRKITQLLGTQDYMNEMRVAFREIGQDEFTILHPGDLGRFSIA